MPARRRITPRQMEILLEFAESNHDIALGRLTGGPLAHQATRQAWVSLADRLNSIAEGSVKTPDQWRRYWIEFKAKTKSKAADSRRNASATGGGPNRLVPLTHAEERVLALIGPVAVEGLPGVRVPFDIPTAEGTRPEAVPASPSAALPMPHSHSLAPYPDTEPPMDVEFLIDEEVPSPLGVQFPEPSSSLPLHNLFLLDHDYVTPPGALTMTVTPPLLAPNLDPPLGTGTPAAATQPAESPREERPPVHLTPPTHSSTSRRQRSRRIRRDEQVPRWVYDLDMRRMDAEERHASAMQALVERIASAMEAMVELMRGIRDDNRRHGPSRQTD